MNDHHELIEAMAARLGLAEGETIRTTVEGILTERLGIPTGMNLNLPRLQDQITNIETRVTNIATCVTHVETQVGTIENRATYTENRVSLIEGQMNRLRLGTPEALLPRLPAQIDQMNDPRAKDSAIRNGLMSTWSYMYHNTTKVALTTAHNCMYFETRTSTEHGTVKNAKQFLIVPQDLIPYAVSVVLLPSALTKFGTEWSSDAIDDVIVVILNAFPTGVDDTNLMQWNTSANLDISHLQTSLVGGNTLLGSVRGRHCTTKCEQNLSNLLFIQESPSGYGYSGAPMFNLTPRPQDHGPTFLGIYRGLDLSPFRNERGLITRLPHFRQMRQYPVVTAQGLETFSLRRGYLTVSMRSVPAGAVGHIFHESLHRDRQYYGIMIDTTQGMQIA